MYEEQLEGLRKYFRNAGPLLLAFSGGVDSCLLAYLAHQELGKKMTAVTIRSPYTPSWEVEEAIAFAKEYSIAHEIIELPVPSIIKNNPKDRCYLCKKAIFTKILGKATELNIPIVVDGSNHDDLNDYRPGMRALKELDIKSPMLELGIKKEQLRVISKELGLDTWNKPSCACLLSRLPYETEITIGELNRIAASELILKDYGILGARVRSHGVIARIEVSEQYFSTIVSGTVRHEISEKIKEQGYTFIAIDLDSFKSGSMNRSINLRD